ncbi:PilZ domain-containing protein [Sphaerotilus sp.]|uniref:PilZ domain-containing protein n=1 Tax=Sphaerotilus sp. TaxID=2093942 RepID=UPI002ACEE2DA|nr:PilZ domain-containing protein [Sphaerotilus sp.]MDZ7856447.1 PilZ domain-containing protein [Sphaerotilus sp.]
MVNTPTRGSIESRKEPRFSVTWRGRLTLPDGQVQEVRVRDISEKGVGLLSDLPLPSNTVMLLVLGVPDLKDLSRIMAVPVHINTAYVVMQSHDFRVGGTWIDLNDTVRTLLQGWMRKLSFKA